MDALRTYRSKRDFTRTTEPTGGQGHGLAQRYSVQMHDATRLHWDLRLEWDGVLLSWAVTRGLSGDPADKRLAVRTEDHPLDYLTWEGTIPKGQYGGGTVMLWDLGWWQPLHDVAEGLAQGHLHFRLHGQRATGGWSLVRMKGRRADRGRENWLMIKERDDDAGRHLNYDRSVSTHRTLAQIADGAPPQPLASRKAAVPRFRTAQLAQLVAEPPDGEDWWHEVKHDGYRAQVAIGKGGVVIRTRSGQDWTDRFAELAPPLAALDCDSALIDGEIVAGAGLQGFSALQAAIKAGGPFLFYAFDLLTLDGVDMADRPLTDRRAALERLLADHPPHGFLRLSPILQVGAAEALDAVCAAGGEGIVSKSRHAPYRGGRSSDWQKTKCIRRAEFVIVGYQPSDKRGRAFASLLVATMEGGVLRYRGKVGTGFDAATQRDLVRAFIPRKSPPLQTSIRAKWIEPRLVAEIAYAERTADGLLRHARFVALREDKRPEDVAMDPAAEVDMNADNRPKIAGIGISNGDRIVFPKPRTTKLDLIRYYEDMADRILPTLADRPCSLVRLPEGLEGERFFQKHAGKGFPAAVRHVDIDDDPYIRITNAAGLVGAAQMGTVEFHPWGARADRLDRPERLVFDLDPDDGVGFAATRRAAVEVRDFLVDLGLASWPLLSGGKGIHVIVPLRRTVGWDTARTLSQLVAMMIADRSPDRFTATMSKAKRKGRIFLDWLRNERGATAIAPFSVRARPGAPVAVPVTWNELSSLRRADAFGMKAAKEREWPELPKPSTINASILERLHR